ncbi:PREDICTED: probable tyrosyl-DNA phosphodiesterase [Trachymyrmex septentrionalis]|uniref:probable tyrosyl-DNA phosphodiesterase n=1 Tax=Trachymyrmex septentrionalis TaxID=34720 RepID=UPI00084ED1E7|nr:PREDICTED: probable tyrosyl-DNA phosphodiesterase [Trachymyrmex septentrionalis]
MDARTQTSTTSRLEYLMHKYPNFDSKKLRKEARKMAIQEMKRIGYTVMVVTPGKFAKKYASSAPYHLFFTRVENSKKTHNQRFSITFSEILDRSLGKIVNSLHLTFAVNVGWLSLQYLLAGQRTDMTILYKHRICLCQEELSKNITIIKVDGQHEFSSHHTNIMILQYRNGIRVIVSTAALYSDDWKNRTQGLWISPHLPSLPESANPDDGESPTGFKKDLERYLSKYEQPALTQWIRAVQMADFSDVNVFLVASVPGIHIADEANFWGYKKLAYILSRYVTLPPDAQWPIVAQSSVVGRFGSKFESWLKDITWCMSEETFKGPKNHPQFQFIYPSIENHKQRFDYQDLITPLRYSTEIHSKQQWLEQYLYQWKAKRTERDRAMPNIKSYTRISPDSKRISWFLLTSANLSKASWGLTKQYEGYSIGNYEAGVIFIPKFITGTITFPVGEEQNAAVPVFPIPYDLPLSRYESDDSPFVNEFVNSLN